MIHASEMATVWVVRAGRRGELVRIFLDDGEVGLVRPDFPDGTSLDRTGALRILGVGMDDEPTKHQEAEVALFLSFVRRIAVGDIVALVDDAAGGLVCGVVTGDYRFRTELDPSRAPHRRPVDWRRRLPVDELPERLADVPDQRADLTDLADGRLRAIAQQCCREERGQDPFDRPAVPVRAARSRAPRARTPRKPAPTRPSQVQRDQRRCTVCLVTKPTSLFDDGSDVCNDCL